ncbi:MAG TPA: hypothetical protein VK810_06855 [Dongiaceae bacterium]|nr:hypothetical protein [Dongiaceae bacterium]
MQPKINFTKKSFRMRAVFVLFCALLSLPAFADDEAHIKDLASRYDFVGIITDTSVLKWNTNPDSSKMAKIYPIDPNKVPGGALYVGIAKDANDKDFPYFGDIYVKGKLYGYNQIFVRVHDVKGQKMQAMDDGGDNLIQGGNEYVIEIIRTGSGYKRQ